MLIRLLASAALCAVLSTTALAKDRERYSVSEATEIIQSGDARKSERHQAALDLSWAESLPPETVQALARLAVESGDDDSLTCTAAIGALAKHPKESKPTVPILLSLLQAKDSHIRWNAMKALNEIAGGTAVVRAAQRSLLKDSDSFVRVQALRGMGEDDAMAEENIPLMCDVLAEPPMKKKREHDTDDARAAAASEMKELVDKGHGKQVMPCMETIIRSIGDPDTRVQTASSGLIWRLGQAGFPVDAAAPALIKNLTTEHSGLLKATLYALEHTGDAGREAVPEIIALLKHKDAFTRRAAQLALQTLDTPEARKALKGYTPWDDK